MLHGRGWFPEHLDVTCVLFSTAVKQKVGLFSVPGEGCRPLVQTLVLWVTGTMICSVIGVQQQEVPGDAAFRGQSTAHTVPQNQCHPIDTHFEDGHSEDLILNHQSLFLRWG